MALFGKQRLGIDLGTANTIIYIENKGIALREPSIIAINSETKEVVAYGKEAAALVGRTSDKYETIHPIQDGVIADFSLTKHAWLHPHIVSFGVKFPGLSFYLWMNECDF